MIVVDVEDRDASVWQNLSAYDGGVSGWRLLWDRWCPIPSLRCAHIDFAAPRCTLCQRHAPALPVLDCVLSYLHEIGSGSCCPGVAVAGRALCACLGVLTGGPTGGML